MTGRDSGRTKSAMLRLFQFRDGCTWRSAGPCLWIVGGIRRVCWKLSS